MIDAQAMQCADSLGIAEGLVTLLRGISHNARHNRVYLPMDLMVKHGLKPVDVLHSFQSRCPDKKLKAATKELAERADQHLQECKRASQQLKADERLVLLPAVAVNNYLSQFKKVSYSRLCCLLSTYVY